MIRCLAGCFQHPVRISLGNRTRKYFLTNQLAAQIGSFNSKCESGPWGLCTNMQIVPPAQPLHPQKPSMSPPSTSLPSRVDSATIPSAQPPPTRPTTSPLDSCFSALSFDDETLALLRDGPMITTLEFNNWPEKQASRRPWPSSSTLGHLSER